MSRSRRAVIRGISAAILAGVAGTYAFAPAVAADAALVEAAKKEGKLVIYGDPFTVPLLIKGFSAKYPEIRVTSATGDAWQMYNRFVSEVTANRPLLDVMYQAEDTVITAQSAGYLAPFESDAQTSLLPFAVPASGGYVRGNANLIMFAYNSSALGSAPVPNDWVDYIDPPASWNGLIATTNPASSSATFSAVSAIYQLYGPEKGGTILQGLRKAGAELTPSMGVMSTKLQTGERPLNFFNITTAVSGLLAKGAPVELKVPESGAVAQFNSLGISAKAPNPNAARLFVEYALSEEMQETFSQAGVYATRQGIATPPNLPAIDTIKFAEFDLVKALADRETIINWWSQNTGFSYR